MCELYIRAADHLNGLHDLVRLLLKAFLTLFGDGQHGRGAEGVSGVNTHGVNVFDEADGDHVVVRVPDDLKL